MNPSKQLDETLAELSEYNFTTKLAMFSEKLNCEMDVLKQYLLLEQLEKDGYATISKDCKDLKYDSYWISYSGLLFIEQGGYRRKIKADQISSALDIFQFWVLVVAAICASLYYAYEIVKIVYSFVVAESIS